MWLQNYFRLFLIALKLKIYNWTYSCDLEVRSTQPDRGADFSRRNIIDQLLYDCLTVLFYQIVALTTVLWRQNRANFFNRLDNFLLKGTKAWTKRRIHDCTSANRIESKNSTRCSFFRRKIIRDFSQFHFNIILPFVLWRLLIFL